MAFIDLARKEINCKIVFYGPGRGGKTTNLIYLHKALKSNAKGKMVSIDTKGDRTLFFDFLPLAIGKIRGLDIKIQLYTVPGQVMYNATRKLVLKGVDGIVFVADSLSVQKEKNIESLDNLIENLQEENIDIKDIPLVLQYNKRDMDGGKIPLLSIEEMDQDMNSTLKVPSLPASALKGTGVFDTLKIISKLTIRYVSQKVAGR